MKTQGRFTCGRRDLHSNNKNFVQSGSVFSFRPEEYESPMRICLFQSISGTPRRHSRQIAVCYPTTNGSSSLRAKVYTVLAITLSVKLGLQAFLECNAYAAAIWAISFAAQLGAHWSLVTESHPHLGNSAVYAIDISLKLKVKPLNCRKHVLRWRCLLHLLTRT